MVEGLAAVQGGVPDRLREVGAERAEAASGARHRKEIERQQRPAGIVHHAREPVEGRFGDACAVAETRRGQELRRIDLPAVHAIDAPEPFAGQFALAHFALGGDEAPVPGNVDGPAIDREDDASGLVGHAAQFGAAFLDHQLAESVLVEFADIVVSSLQNPVPGGVDQPLAAVQLHFGEAVHKAPGGVEAGFDHPALVAGLVAVFPGLPVPGGPEVLGGGGQREPRRQDAR